MEKGNCYHTRVEDRALTGTWVTAEVDEALKNGYELIEIKEIYHWTCWHSDFYKDFIRTFLKIKVRKIFTTNSQHFRIDGGKRLAGRS